MVLLLVSRFDPGIQDNDITERFYRYSYPAPLLAPLMVASDLADKNSTKLGHAEHSIHEILKKDLGFHCISSPDNAPGEEYHGAFGNHPKYYPEIKKEDLVPEIKKEDLGAFGFPCSAFPKYYPEIKKEGLEALGFRFISSPKNVPEISKGDLETLGFQFISSPSNVPENKKEHLEAFGIHFINSSKNAPGINKECPELWRFHVATYPKVVQGMPRFSPWLHVVGTPPTSGVSMDAEFILYLDSGAGCHVVHQAELLTNLRDPPSGSTRVKAADGVFLTVLRFGDIKTNDFLIPDVCLVQGLKKNLVSVGQLASSSKVSLDFNWNGCDVISYDDGSLVGSAVLRGDNQYVLSSLKIQ